MGNYIFGGMGFTSLLTDKLRQKKGLSYVAESFLAIDSQDDYGRFGIFAGCNPNAMDTLDGLVDEVVAKAHKEGVTEDLLKQGREGYLKSMRNDRAEDKYLVSMLSEGLYLGRTMEYYAELERKVSRLTVADVNAALRRYLDPRRLVIVRAGDFAAAKGGAPK
jgi:zinc protease